MRKCGGFHLRQKFRRAWNSPPVILGALRVVGLEADPLLIRAQRRGYVPPVGTPLTSGADPQSHQKAAHGKPVGLVRSPARRIALRAHVTEPGFGKDSWRGRHSKVVLGRCRCP